MSKAASSIATKETRPSSDQGPFASTIGTTGQSILPKIAAHARLHPDTVALVMGSTSVTYGELENRGTQLASHLRAHGAGVGRVVGICFDRSPEFVIAALATLKSGAAYLPLDSSQPSARLRFMANDASARLIVTRTGLKENFSGIDAHIVTVDSAKTVIEQEPANATTLQGQDESLAYVIYTSGSTGQPKGVEITNRNLSHLVSWHLDTFGLDPSTRTTFLAGVGFDAAVWEIWPALVAGATLYLPDESTRMSPEALRDWFVRHGITISFVPTAIAEQMLALPWPGQTALRFLLTGADALHRYPPPGLPFSLVNNYGPTECTVLATSGIVLPGGNQTEPPSIGRPIDRVQVHILDEQLHRVPSGVTGEIYIGGAGVGRGYRNRPELTAERFVSDPFSSNGGQLYRTGDLARELPDGEIAFLGRIDDQVKIRGYRIELGEINAILNKHPSVKTASVIAWEDPPNEKKLVAYVVPAAGSKPDEQSLRDSIRKMLPAYMQPAAFVWMDSLPLTLNGKVNRSALPPAPNYESDSAKRFVEPRTPVEEALARIIADVLKLPRISIEDDFFHLGAHSLLGAQIIARVRASFGADLKLLDVFDAPTVAKLAIRIEHALVRRLNTMSEAEVDAALAAFDQTAGTGIHSP